MRVRDNRVAQVGDPADAGCAFDGRADQMDGRRRRRRQHDIDPLAPDDADRRRDSGQVPTDVLVGEQQPPARETRVHADAFEPLAAVQLFRRLAAFWAEVARAVHPRERRRLQLVVPVDPFRIVGSEHVCLDAEARQVGRELEGTLHSTASRRREVHGDEQNFHSR